MQKTVSTKCKSASEIRQLAVLSSRSLILEVLCHKLFVQLFDLMGFTKDIFEWMMEQYGGDNNVYLDMKCGPVCI